MPLGIWKYRYMINFTLGQIYMMNVQIETGLCKLMTAEIAEEGSIAITLGVLSCLGALHYSPQALRFLFLEYNTV